MQPGPILRCQATTNWKRDTTLQLPGLSVPHRVVVVAAPVGVVGPEAVAVLVAAQALPGGPKPVAARVGATDSPLGR